MPYPTDNLGPLLTPPVGGHGDMFFGQGRLLSWNPETFENRVEFRGSVFENLTVLGGVGALSWHAGDLVQLQGWSPRSGAGVWFILGNAISPSATAAADTIAFMQSSVAKQIAAQVFAERITEAEINDATTTTSTSFGDGTGDPGPSVTVEISPTGKAMVFMGCSMFSGGVDTFDALGGRMGIEVSGATSIAPINTRAFANLQGVAITALGYSHSTSSRASALHTFTVNPGVNTFTAKYATLVSGNSTSFSARSLVVIAF